MYKVTKSHREGGSDGIMEYADIYVSDNAELATVSTAGLIQGSKAYIVGSGELYVLNEDGGTWCDSDGNAFAAPTVLDEAAE